VRGLLLGKLAVRFLLRSRELVAERAHSRLRSLRRSRWRGRRGVLRVRPGEVLGRGLVFEGARALLYLMLGIWVQRVRIRLRSFRRGRLRGDSGSVVERVLGRALVVD